MEQQLEAASEQCAQLEILLNDEKEQTAARVNELQQLFQKADNDKVRNKSSGKVTAMEEDAMALMKQMEQLATLVLAANADLEQSVQLLEHIEGLEEPAANEQKQQKQQSSVRNRGIPQTRDEMHALQAKLSTQNAVDDADVTVKLEGASAKLEELVAQVGKLVARVGALVSSAAANEQATNEKVEALEAELAKVQSDAAEERGRLEVRPSNAEHTGTEGDMRDRRDTLHAHLMPLVDAGPSHQSTLATAPPGQHMQQSESGPYAQVVDVVRAAVCWINSHALQEDSVWGQPVCEHPLLLCLCCEFVRIVSLYLWCTERFAQSESLLMHFPLCALIR